MNRQTLSMAIALFAAVFVVNSCKRQASRPPEPPITITSTCSRADGGYDDARLYLDIMSGEIK